MGSARAVWRGAEPRTGRRRGTSRRAPLGGGLRTGAGARGPRPAETSGRWRDYVSPRRLGGRMGNTALSDDRWMTARDPVKETIE